MNIVKFGNKIIHVDRVHYIQYYPDQRREGQEDYDWLQERFVFVLTDEGDGITVYSPDPGFESFKTWFFDRIDGLVHNASVVLQGWL